MISDMPKYFCNKIVHDYSGLIKFQENILKCHLSNSKPNDLKLLLAKQACNSLQYTKKYIRLIERTIKLKIHAKNLENLLFSV